MAIRGIVDTISAAAAAPSPAPAITGRPDRAGAATTDGPEGGTFSDVLKDALSQARAQEARSEELARQFADGDPRAGIHEVMIAAEKASISVRYAVTLKNRAIEAFRELMSTSL